MFANGQMLEEFESAVHDKSFARSWRVAKTATVPAPLWPMLVARTVKPQENRHGAGAAFFETP